jgi:exopolysaccharide production protein ExoQ
MQQMTGTLKLATKEPLYALVLTWVLLFPLLCFAAEYSFSFESGGINTGAGASFATQGMSEKSPVLRIQMVAAFLICAFLVAPCIRAIGANFRRDMLIFSLPLLAGLSCIWSQNRLRTLEYTVLLLIGLALSFYLVERFSATEIVKLFLIVGTAAAISSLVVIAFLPQYGLQSRSLIALGAWQGIFSQKNTCGEAMTFLLLAGFFVEVKSPSAKVFRAAYVAVVLLIIAMSRSASAWVICASCILFIVTMHFFARMPRKDVAVVALLLVGIAGIAGILAFQYFDVLMLAIGKDPTMTKRTILWAGLVPSIMKHPLLGYGFMAFWQGLRGESANIALIMNWPGESYAENGVIELCLELGTIGVALYLLVFVRAVKDAIYCFKKKPSSTVMWYISLLFVLAISNIAGGVLLSPVDLKFLLPMVAFIGLRREAQRMRSLRIA